MSIQYETLMEFVDNMNLYEEDGKTLINLINNTEDKLFVTIMEHIMLGNLYISDFDEVFSHEYYGNDIGEEIKSQDSISTRLERIITFKEEIMNLTISNYEKLQKIAVTETSRNFTSSESFNDLIEERYLDFIDTIKNKIHQNTDLTTAIKLKMLDNLDTLSGSEEDIQSMLLSADDYVMPLQYDDQVLNDLDKEYMEINNIPESTMKKIKSLATFFRTNK